MKNFYITTAIDYANGSPHLGHAYEKVLADTLARTERLKGNNVHFLTGLDEHGQKVQQSAKALGLPEQQLCDDIAKEFQGMCANLDISNDDYIRTTEPRHKEIVRSLLQTLYDKGEIYKAEYTGFYSVRQEQFVQEKDMVDGKWPEIFGEVIEITEENYFFKLSQYQGWLAEWIASDECQIFPAFRKKQVLEFLKEKLNDLCISRPKERLAWGIELPFDAEYVTYVWFDALTNYISAIGYGQEGFENNWPVDRHIIGKDILVPAHAIYWPVMLKAAGIPVPKGYIVHGWWTMSGEKMSKSTGKALKPLDLAQQFSMDAFRYFLMREMTVGQDSDFSIELFNSRYTAELGNDLGNLVSRFLNMTARYSEGKVPAQTVNEEPEQTVKDNWIKARDTYLEQFDKFSYNRGLEALFEFIAGLNAYTGIREPWKLAKSDDPADAEKVSSALAVIGEGLRLSACLLTPVMPGTSGKILELVGSSPCGLWEGRLVWGDTLVGQAVGDKTILFPRVEIE
jgi:methionyl-tRNA synthetase